MLLYCNRSFLRVVLTFTGSVFFNPWTVFQGLCLAGIAVVLQFFIESGNRLAPKLPSHYGILALGGLVGFAVVFRMNLAWGRYWEAVTQLHFMYSKWADAFSQIFAFARVSVELITGDTDADRRKRERLLLTMDKLTDHFSLLSAIASDRLAHGDTLRMERRASTHGWKDQIAMRRDLRKDHIVANDLPEFVKGRAGDAPWVGTTSCNAWLATYGVTGLPTKAELEALQSSTDRPNVVMYWIINQLAWISGDILIAAPIQSRVYQELSNGMLGFNQAQKIADVPFPFPYAQLLLVLLTCFALFIPVYMVVFTRSYIAAPILSFLLFEGIWGMNETAKELENPFGADSNDITLADFHARFVDLIEEIRGAHTAITEVHEQEKAQKAL